VVNCTSGLPPPPHRGGCTPATRRRGYRNTCHHPLARVPLRSRTACREIPAQGDCLRSRRRQATPRYRHVSQRPARGTCASTNPSARCPSPFRTRGSRPLETVARGPTNNVSTASISGGRTFAHDAIDRQPLRHEAEPHQHDGGGVLQQHRLHPRVNNAVQRGSAVANAPARTTGLDRAACRLDRSSPSQQSHQQCHRELPAVEGPPGNAAWTP